MPDGVIKLFAVEGKYSCRWMSQILNFGDDYGERHDFTKIVVARTPEEAIAQEWSKREADNKEYRAKIKEVDDEIKELREQGKHKEADERVKRAKFPFIGEFAKIPPPVPQDREKWIAREVKAEGYRIVLVPEVVGMMAD